MPTTSAAAFINAGTANVNSSGAVACDLFLGFPANTSGSVSIAGGSLTVVNEIEAGGSGTGKLSITNGGTVSAGLLTIAALSSASVGTVAVDGSTFTISGRCDVGGDNQTLGGVALLSLTNDSSVSAGNVHVFKSGTLTGNATVSTTNGTSVDGTLAPNGGGGTLTIGGNLSFGSLGTMQCKVTPQDPSTTPQLSVSAQVSLQGRLSVTMTGDFSSAPTRFTLLYADTFDSIHRKFDSQSITYPTGQGCWAPQITYDYTGGHVHIYLDRVFNCNWTWFDGKVALRVKRWMKFQTVHSAPTFVAALWLFSFSGRVLRLWWK
jgi:T5SS/PEP-CTERM-associated repeat protein